MLAAIGLAVLGTVAPTPSPSRATGVAASVHEPLEQAFHRYGDAGMSWSGTGGRQWTGGDSTYSVPLPDGRTVWMFSDTFLSPTYDCGSPEEPCHQRSWSSPLVNNSFVVEEAGGLTTTLHGGTGASPTALIRPPVPHDLRSFYWMGDGVVEGGELRVFVRRFPVMGTLPPTAEAVDIATFSLPDLRLVRIDEGIGAGGVRPWAFVPPSRELPVPVTWGAAILEDADFTYIYGTEEYPLFKHLHVARVARGQLLTAPWEHFDGTGWSPLFADSARILSGVAGELSVVRTSAGYRMVTSRGGIGDVHLNRAPAPAGPWDAGTLVFTPPERARGAAVYNAHEHPSRSTAGRLVFSYNVNGSIDGRDYFADTHVYRPRFVELDLGTGETVTSSSSSSS